MLHHKEFYEAEGIFIFPTGRYKHGQIFFKSTNTTKKCDKVDQLERDKTQIIEWFKKLEQAADAGKNVVAQVIKTFVDKVYLWDEKAIIVLTLPNTQETVTFEQIREFEMLSDDGSCNNGSLLS